MGRGTSWVSQVVSRSGDRDTTQCGAEVGLDCSFFDNSNSEGACKEYCVNVGNRVFLPYPVFLTEIRAWMRN
jgi:hypothetical protein